MSSRDYQIATWAYIALAQFAPNLSGQIILSGIAVLFGATSAVKGRRA
jgi:hypothetical protein